MEIDSVEKTNNTTASSSKIITKITGMTSDNFELGDEFDELDNDSPLFQVFNQNVQKDLDPNSRHQFSLEAGGLVTIPKPTAERSSAPTKSSVDYTKPPKTGRYVTSTCSYTEKTLYFPKIDLKQQKTKEKGKSTMKPVDKRMNLLEKPIWQMKRDIDEQKSRVRKRDEDEK